MHAKLMYMFIYLIVLNNMAYLHVSFVFGALILGRKESQFQYNYLPGSLLVAIHEYNFTLIKSVYLYHMKHN